MRRLHLDHGPRGLDAFSQPGFNVFYDAGTLIVICARPLGPFVVADCWLAAENLMLEARGRGLGSCVIGSAVAALNEPATKRDLGIPADSTAVAPLIVGTPRGGLAEEPPPAARDPRLALAAPRRGGARPARRVVWPGPSVARTTACSCANLADPGSRLAPLAFGGNVFGWTADEATSFALLDAFVAAGFNLIDTADVYSRWVPGHAGGESETIIGRWLVARGKRDRVLIATKAGMDMGGGHQGLSTAYILQAVERLARAAAHRLHRPLPGAPRRSGDAAGGDARGVRAT